MASKYPPPTFRAVNEADEAFLLALYESTREMELNLTAWNSAQREAFLKMQFAAQQQHYQTHYPHGDHRLILQGDVPIGRLYVARLSDEIRILDITILPAHRGQGIGTAILKELIEEAASAGKPLRIYVESFNPSLRLFERLGFSKTAESALQYFMEWREYSR